jgi:hypothetical protein
MDVEGIGQELADRRQAAGAASPAWKSQASPCSVRATDSFSTRVPAGQLLSLSVVRILS